MNSATWREAFLTHFGAGSLAGITLGRWLRVLRENQFRIDPPYWGRAAAITLAAIPNTALGWWENLRYGRQIVETRIAPPLLVLGIWRSGTTYLHNLLAQDQRFAFPTAYQAVYPHTFLTTEKSSARLVGWFLPETRPQDNVRLSIDEPQEDEWALNSLTGRTFLMSLIFPRRADDYDRYLTLRQVPEKERAEWLSAFQWFLQKLSFRYGRPLVLKFHEVGFEELEKDPVGVVRGIYEALGLPAFQEVEPALRRYVDSLSGYRKNTFSELPADLRQRISRQWVRCFEEWRYPT